MLANSPFYNTVNMDVMDRLTGLELEHNTTRDMQRVLAFISMYPLDYNKRYPWTVTWTVPWTGEEEDCFPQLKWKAQQLQPQWSSALYWRRS